MYKHCNYTGGVDYINTTLMFVFQPSTTQGCYDLRPINDLVVEPDDELRLILSTDDDDVDIASPTSDVTIVDDDSELLMVPQ